MPAKKKNAKDSRPQLSNKAARAQLESFIDKYSPEVAAIARATLKKMRKRLPGTVELVYDNYNALAIGFGSSERASEALFSIALCPRWVNFFFIRGASLPDPDHVLQGNGNQARHVRLLKAAEFDRPELQRLIDETIHCAKVPIDPKQSRRTVIRAVLAKQRPRRPR
jgi:hypothetical protein